MVNTVIVGAGPYGLSIAAHIRQLGIPFRIFGRPMDSWLAHMPKGMQLKSDGFASDIYDPESAYTLRHFCAERGISYADSGLPVRLDTFSAYGLAFREKMLPELEDKQVTSLESVAGGYRLKTDDGHQMLARRVVLAVGITHFAYIPAELAKLPESFVSHSFAHHELEGFKGLKVVVMGGGSSAIDMAGLLHETGVDVRLVSRRESLKFHTKPSGKPRSLLDKIRSPKSGLGPGWKNRFFSNAPGVFYYFPESIRLELVRRILGPSGGWFARDTVIDKVPLMMGQTLQSAEVKDNKVHLHLRSSDGTATNVVTDHVVAATGYRVDLKKLKFVDSGLRSKIKTITGSPVLSSSFESSVPGLYFAGVSAAIAFGPLMRFAYGAGFAARTLARALAKPVPENSLSVAPERVLTTK